MNSTKYLSDDERSFLESYLRKCLESDTRNAVILLVALHSGARANELLSLTWADIDTKSGAVFIRTSKTYKRKPEDTDQSFERKRKAAALSNAREVVLPRFILKPLESLKTLSPVKPFDLSYNRLGEIWREYRPVVKPLHCLRHTFAMRAYERTADIRFVQRALGHKSITNTMIYADHAYSASEFKKLMRVR